MARSGKLQGSALSACVITGSFAPRYRSLLFDFFLLCTGLKLDPSQQHVARGDEN